MRGRCTWLAALFCVLLLAGTAAARVSLKFVTPAWQPEMVDEIEDVVAEWNAANPGIHIELVWVPWENINDYLLTSFQAGQAPDLFHQDAVMCYEYGLLGYAEPLNAYIDAATWDDITERSWEEVADPQGLIYGIPFLQETQVIFYNRAMFREAGLEVPEDGMLTWQQLREYAQILTRRDARGNVTTWGLMAPLEQRLWWCLVAQNGGRVLREGDDGRWFVDIDDAAKEAIRFYIDLVIVDQVMSREILSYDFMSLLAGFRDGRYAMFSFGCWVRQWLEMVGRKQLDWGMLWVKGPVRNVTEADPQAVGIYVGSKHKDEAAQFLRFFTNTENQVRLAKADWLFPTRSSALERPEFRSAEFQWDVAYQWLPYAEDVKPQMFGILAWEWQSFIPQIELVILGRQTLESALQAATVQGNQFLRRMGLQ